MTDDEIKEWIKTEEGKRIRNELCFKEDGSNSFYVIDDRQCSIKDLKFRWRIYSINMVVVFVLIF